MTITGKSRIKQINMLIFLETNMFQFQRKEVQIYNQEVRKNPVTIIWIITNSRLFFFNYPVCFKDEFPVFSLKEKDLETITS